MLKEIIEKAMELEFKNFLKQYNNEKVKRNILLINDIYNDILKICKAYGQIETDKDKLLITIRGKRIINIEISKDNMNIKIYTTNYDLLREIEDFEIKNSNELLNIIKRTCKNRI